MSEAVDVHLQKDLGIAMAFSEMGYDSTIMVGRAVFSKVARKNLAGNVQVIPTGFVRGKFVFNPFELVRTFKEFRRLKPDIVLVQGMWVVAPVVILAIKICEKFHLFNPKASGGTRFALKMDTDGREFSQSRFAPVSILILILNYLVFDRLIVESTCGLRRIRRVPFAWRKVVLIPSGYSTRAFPKVRHSDTRRRPVILAVCRIERRKGLETLVRAFRIISQAHPDWELHVVGPVDDAKYYAELLRIIDRCEIRGVVFIDSRSGADLVSKYTTSEIYCLSSRSEGYPIARVEAIACGLPVVTSLAGCGEDFGRNGALLFEPGDVDGLASQLFKLVRNPGLRESIASSLQGSILSWNDVAKKIEDSLTA